MSKLKCWKRGTQSWNKDSWDYKTKKYDFNGGKGLIIIKVKTNEAPSYNKNCVHEVFIEKEKGRERKLFKTHTQAVSFAQKYMKNHDRC